MMCTCDPSEVFYLAQIGSNLFYAYSSSVSILKVEQPLYHSVKYSFLLSFSMFLHHFLLSQITQTDLEYVGLSGSLCQTLRQGL